MASASGGRVRSGLVPSSLFTSFPPKNDRGADLAHTQEMGYLNGCQVISFPRRITLEGDEHPEFTAYQVFVMRQFLDNNNANLGQVLTTFATDEKKSMELFIARAYNATISDQQRKILSKYRSKPKFTFCDIGSECGLDCNLRVPAIEFGNGSGCASHDVVQYWDHEDPYFPIGYPGLLRDARRALNDLYHGYTFPFVADRVRESMYEVVERLDENISRPGIFSAPELYEEKFVALDVQYKILHCLLTEENSIKHEIKAQRERWEHMEACFMKVLERFDKDDLRRLATDDQGIWCEMFGFVCHWADKEHILPRLSEARQIIAGSS